MTHHSPAFSEEYLTMAQNSWLFQNVPPETVCRLCRDAGQAPLLCPRRGDLLSRPL